MHANVEQLDGKIQFADDVRSNPTVAMQRLGLNSQGGQGSVAQDADEAKQEEHVKVSGWSRLASKATNKQVIQYKHGASYDGHVNKEGVRHGEGVLVFPGKQARFHGVFEHG